MKYLYRNNVEIIINNFFNRIESYCSEFPSPSGKPCGSNLSVYDYSLLQNDLRSLTQWQHNNMSVINYYPFLIDKWRVRVISSNYGTVSFIGASLIIFNNNIGNYMNYFVINIIIKNNWLLYFKKIRHKLSVICLTELKFACLPNFTCLQ